MQLADPSQAQLTRTPYSAVLVSPEIPGNIGAIMRTCACFGVSLHIVGPLPFIWDVKRVKREVMDYFDLLDLHLHDNFDSFYTSEKRLITTCPRATMHYNDFQYQENDYILFGCESRGLPASVMALAPASIKIPMIQGRSLNLSVSVGIVMAEVTTRFNVKRPG